jgi:phosphoribosylaminoimidazole-succinocarboxamide synthase
MSPVARTLADLGLRPLRTGKVRELFDVDGTHLLMVASDRISAFDVVMAEPIPDKGRVLTAMTAFWDAQLGPVAPRSLVSCDPAVIDEMAPGFAALVEHHGRTMLVRTAEMLPLECIVRARLAGQAWEEYERSGTIHSMPAPAGLRLADALPEPMFTPSTKAEAGHDLNISLTEAAGIIGAERLAQAQELCLGIFAMAEARCQDAGFVLADTKFELGLIDGELVLCDEIVTPDSSRLWPADEIVIGETPPAYDKQPFRDWLAAQPWDRTPPPPVVPADVVALTAKRYRDAYERVTGRSLDEWYGRSS